MPKSTKYAKVKKVVHPNSRKAHKIGKKAIHREKVKSVHRETSLKQSLLQEKLLWVKDYIAEDSIIHYSKQDLCNVVESYLKRFDEELEQIGIIRGIGARKTNQHASRSAAINLTLGKEREDYQSCGIEMPDLCDGRNLKLFLAWDGDVRYLQKIKLRRVKKKDMKDDVDDGEDGDGEVPCPAEQSENVETDNHLNVSAGVEDGDEDDETVGLMGDSEEDKARESDDPDDNTVLDIVDDDLDASEGT